MRQVAILEIAEGWLLPVMPEVYYLLALETIVMRCRGSEMRSPLI